MHERLGIRFSAIHCCRCRLTRILCAVAGLAVATTLAGAEESASNALWLAAGHDAHNTRHQAAEAKINLLSVPNLTTKWLFSADADVSANPAVDGSSVYVPDWAGNLFSVDRKTGQANWSRKISDYTGIPGDRSRSTPAVHGNKLILGNLQAFLGQGAGGWVFAVDKTTGDSVWATRVEDHPAAVITQSAVVHGDRVYVGVSSLEEAFAAVFPGYDCCSFRGSLVSLDVNTGEVLWKTHTAPEISGYSGNAVWGSTAVIDRKRKSVYFTTGNNYSVPDEVSLCVLDATEADPTDEEAVRACFTDAGNFFDSFVALDLDTGSVKWSTQVVPFDAWTVACVLDVINPENCPSPSGPDHDFGQGPALFTVKAPMPHHRRRDLLGAGQKSGVYWVLNPDDGELVWSTQVGPGGPIGGLQWGSATDGERIYTAVANSNSMPWELIQNGVGTGESTQAGLWSALDAATGEILWQTPDPSQSTAQGAVTIANGVVFAGSMAPASDQPTMFALDAATGEILWSFVSGASVHGGAAVVNGDVYWGSGYVNQGLGTPNNKLFAFTVR